MNPMDRLWDLPADARASLDAAARSVLSTRGTPRPVGAVLDASVFFGSVDPTARYVAVVRSPDSYLVVGRYASDFAASVANERFYEGMRALVGAA